MRAGDVLNFLCNDVKTAQRPSANRGHEDATTTGDATMTGDVTTMKEMRWGWENSVDGDGGEVQQEGNKQRESCK